MSLHKLRLLCFPDLQTVFLISVCNNQLLDLVENKLIRLLSIFPGFGLIAPKLIAKLHVVKKKYMDGSPPVTSNGEVVFLRLFLVCALSVILPKEPMFVLILFSTFCFQVKKWDFSIGSIWNTVVWLMLMNFFNKIVSATAQTVLKEEQEKELTALTNNVQASELSSSGCSKASD